MKKENVKNRSLFWFLAFMIAFLGFGTFFYFSENQKLKGKNTELGTCETPEEAFIETQKALKLVSNQLNSGIKNVPTIKTYKKIRNVK